MYGLLLDFERWRYSHAVTKTIASVMRNVACPSDVEDGGAPIGRRLSEVLHRMLAHLLE